jgi:hypothetical protein
LTESPRRGSPTPEARGKKRGSEGPAQEADTRGRASKRGMDLPFQFDNPSDNLWEGRLGASKLPELASEAAIVTPEPTAAEKLMAERAAGLMLVDIDEIGLKAAAAECRKLAPSFANFGHTIDRCGRFDVMANVVGVSSHPIAPVLYGAPTTAHIGRPLATT